MAEKTEEKHGDKDRDKDRGTVRAPLFSEQVALIAQLNEGWARELKSQVQLAQQSPEMKAPASHTFSMFASSALMVFLALTGALASAYLMPGTPLITAAAVGLGVVAESLCLLAFRQQRSESAQLVRLLANTIAKRRKDKDGTNPGFQLPKGP